MKLQEIRAAKSKELEEGGMKMISHQGNDILLTRIRGNIYAVGGHCTHYGAPLDEGVLDGDRLICPWHHARFAAETGDLLDPCALDALPHYQVRIEGENVIVLLPEKIEANRIPDMADYDPGADDRCFVIAGAGAAGYAAAQTLREDGYRGRLVMITPENRPAYDRPTLSKAYLQGNLERESLPLRPDKFYNEHGLELMLERRLTEVNSGSKTVTLDTGETLKYDRLLIATGAKPRRLNVPGAELDKVFLLRSLEDCEAIIRALETAERAVVIGTSFIGLETAASMIRRKKIPVTVIGPEKVPFDKVFGAEIGQMVQSLHEKNGAFFRLGRTVQRIEGEGQVQAVILDNGDRIETDLVIVGIGVQPATTFMGDLEKLPDGSLKVDRFFRVKNDVYAAGDVATFTDWRTGRDLRIEHWRTALEQGRCAGHNMAGRETAYEGIPFFWSSQVGLGLRYVGHAKDWDEIIVQGSISSQEFVAFYLKDDMVQAAVGNKRDRVMDAVEELMRIGRMPSAGEMRANPDLDLMALIEAESLPV